MLLEAGADANKAVINSGLTPLHIAAHYGHEAVVKVLLESGVDANITWRLIKVLRHCRWLRRVASRRC